MTDNPHEAWDPRSPAALTDQIAAYDSMRRQTRVAYSEFPGWSVFHHADTVRMELIVLCEELLRGTRTIEPAEDEDAGRAVYPGSGFAPLPLWFR